MKLTNLRCDYKKDPVGIDLSEPRISWQLHTEKRGARQEAYHVQVSLTADFSTLVWDSGRVPSAQNVHVELSGLHVQPRTRYFYRVQAWDSHAQAPGWSETAFFETGLLDPSGWHAAWISAPTSLLPIEAEQCPMFRRDFVLDRPVRSARIYASSLGMYQLELNGARVSDSVLAPGWTNYHKRIQYQTYDVTAQLRQGENALGAMLGNGWYRGNLGWADNKNLYGDRLALILQLHVTFEDGSEACITSDDAWKSAASPILLSELYHGETYDARLELPGWSEPGFDDAAWAAVDILSHDASRLAAQENVPVRDIEHIAPLSLFTTPNGEVVLDMGQNMVGWMRFSVKGNAGQQVTLRHAEVLDKDGSFYTENLRTAKQEIHYVLRGCEPEMFEPHFTFQGFRYVQLIGFPETIRLEDFTGVVLHSDLEPTGTFTCSDPLINQLQHNITWGLKGNFVDVPTDCPQRDERLGWTGDAQMFIRAAAYLANIAPFFTKWLRDLRADQRADGGVPFVIPNVLGENAHSSSAWGDAAVICPWTLYLCYGDARILEEQYDSMKAWVAYIRSQGDNEYLWNTGFHFGDWLALDSKPDSYVGATDREFIATAFYAYSVSLLTKTAEVLGNTDDAAAYRELYANIVDEFRREFYTPTGRCSVSTQTAQILALMFDLVDGLAKERTEKKLLSLLEESKYHLTTGFVGTPYLNHVLTQIGHPELAYRLLFQQDYPSWLYQVTKGATTIWEHWDGIKEDGSFWSKDMNSFNHYAYGAIGDWLYRSVAGINADERQPGYKHIHIHPQFGKQLTFAEGQLNTMYGLVRSRWTRSDDGFMELEVAIPPNTTADITLPGAAVDTVTESGSLLRDAGGISGVSVVEDAVVVTAGSGTYQFHYPVAADSVH